MSPNHCTSPDLLALRFVKACGPVTTHQIAGELYTQGYPDDYQLAKAYAEAFVRQASAMGLIKKYNEDTQIPHSIPSYI
jgi:hypothetical protein